MFSHNNLVDCRREKLIAKRKKILLRHTKSSEESVSENQSALHHIKRKVDDSVQAMNSDIIDSPITPSPSGDRISLSCGATTTHESGVITSPRSLEDLTEEGQIAQWPIDKLTSTLKGKQKVERTDSDIANHNDLHEYSISTSIPQSTTTYQVT